MSVSVSNQTTASIHNNTAPHADPVSLNRQSRIRSRVGLVLVDRQSRTRGRAGQVSASHRCRTRGHSGQVSASHRCRTRSRAGQVSANHRCRTRSRAGQVSVNRRSRIRGIAVRFPAGRIRCMQARLTKSWPSICWIISIVLASGGRNTSRRKTWKTWRAGR